MVGHEPARRRNERNILVSLCASVSLWFNGVGDELREISDGDACGEWYHRGTEAQRRTRISVTEV
jgi:hypothetical protein